MAAILSRPPCVNADEAVSFTSPVYVRWAARLQYTMLFHLDVKDTSDLLEFVKNTSRWSLPIYAGKINSWTWKFFSQLCKSFHNVLINEKRKLCSLFGLFTAGYVRCAHCWFTSLKTESCHNINFFVVTGGAGGCRYGNQRCYHWRQSWHHDNPWFSVSVMLWLYHWMVMLLIYPQFFIPQMIFHVEFKFGTKDLLLSCSVCPPVWPFVCRQWHC